MLRLALVVFGLSGALSAQLTEKQAIQQLKGDLKASLKVVRQSLAAASGAFDSGVDAADGLLASGATADEFIASLTIAAQQLQEDVRIAVEFAYIHASQHASLALGALDPAIDLTLGYPRDMLPGSGGALDDFEISLRKEVEKAYLKLNKRLEQSAKSAEKNGVGLTWRLVPPVEAFAYVATAGLSTETPALPLRIDFVLAVSELAEDDDAQIVVGGVANLEAGLVSVEFDTGSASDSEVSTVLPATGRWLTGLIDFDLTGGVPEVGYMLIATQGEGDAITSVPFGVR